MLEQKIVELTAAVVALTTAIGKMQAPGPDSILHEIASAPVTTAPPAEEGPNEPTKSKDTTPTSQLSSPESAPVTYDDVKRATNAVSKISRDKAIAGLARFGVASATKLSEAQWPDYVAYMAKVAAGEVDPEASHE